MAAQLSPDLLNRLASYFAQPQRGAMDDPSAGRGATYKDPATGVEYVQGGGKMSEPGYSTVHPYSGSGRMAGSLFDANTGNYSRETSFDGPDKMARFMETALPLALLGGMGAFAAPNLLAALGGGAGAGAGGAAGGSLATGSGLGAGGASLTGGIGTTTGLGYGIGTLPGLAGASYGAGSLGLDAALANLGAAGAAGGAAGALSGYGGSDVLGGAAGDTLESSVPGVFNPAADSQLANEAIGSDALGGYTSAGIPSVTVNGAPSGGIFDSLKAGASSLFGGHSGTNTIGDAGGFNWQSLIGPGLSAIGGISGVNAAKSAADSQLQAAREAAALNEPFRQAGMQGMNRLTDLLGVSGRTGAEGYGSAAKPFSMADYQADPGLEFRRQQGEQGLQRAASASGGLGSGKYLKDAMTFNSGLASQEYGNAFNRFQTNRASVLNPLQSLMGAGQTAANTIGDYTTQGGNAQAAGKVGQANAYTNALGQGYSMYQNQQNTDQNRVFTNALMNRWANGG